VVKLPAFSVAANLIKTLVYFLMILTK